MESCRTAEPIADPAGMLLKSNWSRARSMAVGLGKPTTSVVTPPRLVVGMLDTTVASATAVSVTSTAEAGAASEERARQAIAARTMGRTTSGLAPFAPEGPAGLAIIEPAIGDRAVPRRRTFRSSAARRS